MEPILLKVQFGFPMVVWSGGWSQKPNSGPVVGLVTVPGVQQTQVHDHGKHYMLKLGEYLYAK